MNQFANFLCIFSGETFFLFNQLKTWTVTDLVENFESEQRVLVTHCFEYNITNIFRFSHILPTNLTSLQACEITAKHEDEESIGHIVRGKRSITNVQNVYCLISNLSFIKRSKKTQKNNFHFYLLISR